MRDILTRTLQPPQGAIDMVLDTDTYNEIDDQFALVYAAIAQKLHLRAVYAAPFHNDRSSGPKDGMEKSFAEAERVLSFLEYPSDNLIFRGSESFMGAEKLPVDSEACRNLIALASDYSADNPLYVAAIGAITNVASALMIEPRIKDKIVVVWLGGHPPYWPHNWEFNLMQDPYAAQVVFDACTAVVHVPCKNVAEHVKSTAPELKVLLAEKGKIGTYLYDIFAEYVQNQTGRSKEIWDLAPIAWLLQPDALPSKVMPTPRLTVDDNLAWQLDATRHPYRVLTDAKRDRIFQEFLTALDAYLDQL